MTARLRNIDKNGNSPNDNSNTGTVTRLTLMLADNDCISSFITALYLPLYPSAYPFSDAALSTSHSPVSYMTGFTLISAAIAPKERRYPLLVIISGISSRINIDASDAEHAISYFLPSTCAPQLTANITNALTADTALPVIIP